MQNLRQVNYETDGIETGQDGKVYSYSFKVYGGRVMFISFYDHFPVGEPSHVVTFDDGFAREIVL